jgi:diguanylate cyclase (GGDEF)-like protein
MSFESLKIKLLQMFHILISLGVSKNKPQIWQAIESINITVIILFLGSIAYSIQWYIVGFPLLTWISLSFSLLYLFTLYWVKQGKPLLAAYHVLLASLIHFFIYSCIIFNRESNFHLFFIAIIPISFLLIPSLNRWHHTLFFLLASLAFMTSEIELIELPLYQFPLELKAFTIITICIFLTIALNLSMSQYNRSINQYHYQLALLAQKDELTDIANRRYFIARIEDLAQQGDCDDYFLFSLDLDHFKRINDQYGHAVGDFVLINIVKLVLEVIPIDSIFARLGGEEFAIIIKCDSLDEALSQAECIRSKIANSEMISSDGQLFYCQASQGIAKLTKDYSYSMRQCDDALYKAKEMGRNRYVFNDGDIQRKSRSPSSRNKGKLNG